MKVKKQYSPLFWFGFLSSLLIYIWIFSKTPYGQDDWAWGTDYGMRMLITGGINSRYIGNLLEVIVTRSEFLKAVLLGIIAAFIPVIIVALVKTCIQPEPFQGGKVDNLPATMLLLSNILFLTMPMNVWKETYGWIAGFSNYGLAIFLLAVYQLLILRVVLNDDSNHSLAVRLEYCLFSICIQLVLENMSIYIVLADCIILLFVWKNKEARNLILLMFLGNIAGLAIMFSSKIYGSLFSTGVAVGGYRTLSFNIHDGILNSILLLYQRFVYFYPNNIFENNWLLCCLISFLLFLICNKGNKVLRLIIRLFALFFSLYFVLAHFFGPIEDYFSRWNEVLTQRLNLLFFWGVFFAILFLPWEGSQMRWILAFVWVSVLGVVLPFVAVKIVGSRYFLFSFLFLIEFCMFLFAEVYRCLQKKTWVVDWFLIIAFLVVSIHRFIIYYEIGQGKKEREILIRAAQNGEIDRLYFPDLPHNEYIEINEPLDGSEQVQAFRDFFKIPDSVEMHNSSEDFS